LHFQLQFSVLWSLQRSTPRIPLPRSSATTPALHPRTFDPWSRLFGPGFTSASANATGGVTVRTLTQFLDAQRQGFLRAREMRETLENVRIEQRGRLASIWSDFTFYYDGAPSKGKLVLLAVSDSLGWKFHSLMFAYDK
jgi:hypothetical protein